MATLLGQNINQTYEGLLKTFSSNELESSNPISDGLGNPTALNLGSAGNGSSFDNSLVVGSTLLACNTLTTNSNLCVKGSSTIDNNINVAGNTLISGNLTASNFTFTGAGQFNGGITFNNTITVSGVSNIVDTNVNGCMDITCNLTVGGTINAGGDIIAFSTSDSRLKENLIPIDSENFVSNLTGYEFDWNERSKRSGKGKGVIAQDLYNIDKSLVRENGDGYLTVDYTSLIPVLIEEVKRLGKEIDCLKNLQHH